MIKEMLFIKKEVKLGYKLWEVWFLKWGEWRNENYMLMVCVR